ncbi:hypothetical protein PUNSTDRAFT_30670, partial [Punctularia strigosozonata HHB-11173 SS5]|uniref:uncharacterized protein n=1 Tax=Punctularia strigosozonata (strain HHB-11173) TaxID=741275 RepID=UPI0004417BC9
IRGYSIPGLTAKVVLTLFADDTTVYLSSRDSYRDLQDILRKWCSVSGAKFNLDKTEVVPMGSPEHRAWVVANRMLHPDDEPFGARTKIAADGEAIRSLGAWIGNITDYTAPWQPILEQVRRDFDRWERSNPTWWGKRHIVQWVIGGRTQFLAKAQGMPVDVVKKLQRMEMDFVWAG